MAENFQDNVSYGGSTLAVSGDAIMVGSTNSGSKSVIFNSSGNQGNLVWGPSANRTISLPDASGVIMLTSQAILSISAGGAAITSGQAIFSNSNGVSFGVNGQTITGSVAAQTNQTVGFYAVGNTTQNSSTTLDARTISFDGLGIASVGYSNGSVQISVPSPPAQTNQSVGFYAVGNTTQNSSTTLDARTISFDGLGAATVGFSNGSVQISVPNVVVQTNQTIGYYAVGNTTQNSSTTLDARTVSFNGLGIITVGYSNGSIDISASQSAQSIGYYAVGNTTQNSSTTLDARTVSFNGLGIITVGYSNGSVDISATQSAQSVGLYAVSNTTAAATSTTADARSLSFQGAGVASVGYSNGSVVISVAPGAQTNQTVGFYAVGNTTQNSSTTLDARTISFDGLGAATVGFSNGSVQISAPVQTNQSVGLYAVGNTTQNSSTTLDARTLSFNGLGGATVGYSNGSVQISAPPVRQASQLAWPSVPWQTNFTISNATFSVQHFNPVANITATQANLLMALSGNSGSSGALTVSLGIYTMAGSTMSLASSDSRQLTWTSGSDTTASSLYGGISGTCYRTINLASWNITKGEYMLGAWFRTTNDGTWRAFGIEGPTIVNAQDGNETNVYVNGYSVSSFTTAMPASVNVTNTNYARTGGDAFKQPSMIFFGTF